MAADDNASTEPRHLSAKAGKPDGKMVASKEPRRLPVKAGKEAVKKSAAVKENAVPPTRTGKVKNRNYRCKGGKKLRVKYVGIDTPSPTAVVRVNKKNLRMPVDDSASEGNNLIFKLYTRHAASRQNRRQQPRQS